MAPKLEASAVLEHRRLLAGIHERQLWAEMGMGNTTNAKLQIMGQLWAKYDENQQWAKMSMGLKQYHKGQA
jgi:hypothetical protein